MDGRLYKDFETLYAARGDYDSKLQVMVPYLTGLSGNLLKYANMANAFDNRILFYTGQEVLPFRHGEFTFYALPIGLFLGL